MYSHIHACFIFRSKYAKPCCARASPLAQFSNLGLTLEMDWQWSPQAGPVVDLPGTGAAHDGPEVSAGSSAAKENSSEWAWQSPGTQHWVLPWPTRSCRTQPTDWLCTFGTEREQNCPSSARAAKAEGENLALGRQYDPFLLSCLDLSTKLWHFHAVACVIVWFRNMVWFLPESKSYSFLSLLKYHSNSSQHRCCRHPTGWPGDNGHCSHLGGAPNRRHHVDYRRGLGTVSNTKLLSLLGWQLRSKGKWSPGVQ